MFWIQTIEPREQSSPCPCCGMAAYQLTQTGYVGCEECYRHFRHILMPYIRRLHSANKHTGSIPVSAGSSVALKRRLAQLNHELQAAIAEQEFEKCAALRDEIKKLQEEARS